MEWRDAVMFIGILAGWAYLLRPSLTRFIGIAHTRDFYRNVYMHSLGWRITRWLRKRTFTPFGLFRIRIAQSDNPRPS